jgi:hypothetical protein
MDIVLRTLQIGTFWFRYSITVLALVVIAVVSHHLLATPLAAWRTDGHRLEFASVEAVTVVVHGNSAWVEGCRNEWDQKPEGVQWVVRGDTRKINHYVYT